MNIKDLDFQGMTNEQLKELRISTAIELEDRGVKITAPAEQVEVSIERYQRTSQQKTQAIAANEIQARAEKLLKSATGQRVIL